MPDTDEPIGYEQGKDMDLIAKSDHDVPHISTIHVGILGILGAAGSGAVLSITESEMLANLAKFGIGLGALTSIVALIHAWKKRSKTDFST